MRSAFGSHHPIVCLIYFTVVFSFSMVLMHPICLAISLISSFLWSFYLNGRKTIRLLAALVPLMCISALINAAFNHEGVTILTYLPSENPLTMESLIYGFAASAMLASVMCWFSCFSTVMTSDKFVYLFGRVIPSMSLILSMALRFVPRLRERFGQIRNAQKGMGRDITSGNMKQRLKATVRIFSIMITWSLENAVETADSMKSRGYGLPGRTTFSIYKFDKRDGYTLVLVVLIALCVIATVLCGNMFFRYFPSVKAADTDIWSTAAFLLYAALFNTPIIIDKMEDRKWKYLRSNV